jgi:uncharacterized lipoprotein YddW (UPF0748 family)
MSGIMRQENHFFKKAVSIKTFFFLLLLLSSCTAKKEVRAVWFSTANEYSEEAASALEQILPEYEQMHITHLFWFNNLRDGRYRKSSFQLLDSLIIRAHKNHMKVHPVYYPGAPFLAGGKYPVKKEWFIIGMKGDTLPSLNLSNPEVQQYILSDISEYLKHDIDGIHLDFIRFPVGQGFSYDSTTLSAFQSVYGKSPLEGPRDSGSILWCQWIRWNAEHVTDLVAAIRQLLDSKRKDLLLSVAVFPDHEMALADIGQDWPAWADQRLADIFCPMIYTQSASLFEKYVREAVAIIDKKAWVLPGIATTSVHNTSTPDDVIRQVEICRRAGADGMTFFRLGSGQKEYIEKLKSTVFKQP